MNRRALNHVMRPLARRLPYHAVVHHVGRRTGRAYTTPVNLFRDGDELVVPLTYGPESDWVRNVLEAGTCALEHRGRHISIADVRLETDRTKPWVPWFVRQILRALRVHEVVRLRPA